MKTYLTKIACLVFVTFNLVVFAYAQPRKKLIDVSVVPVNKDWVYKQGERVDFQIEVTRNGKILENSEISLRIGKEGMIPVIDKTMKLTGQTLQVTGMALNEPGFIRCEASVVYQEVTYKGMGTAGVEPYEIQPTAKNPDDFDTFWANAKKELAKVPLASKLTLQPELCQPDYDVYHVEVANYGKPYWQGQSKIYGMLSVPKKKGKYPALLNVPGAGIRPYFHDGRAAEGIIVFNIGIHGIPVNMEKEVYDALAGGPLAGYEVFNMHDKDNYYFKRVYLGCIRAIDFIQTLPEFDGENLVVSGGSQGGALSVVTAALDDRVKGLAAFYPALSDMSGYLNGRVGGWPHALKNVDPKFRELYEHTSGHYDVVNFAKRLKVPGWYSWGFNDNICPPTSTFSVYNSIQSPKELKIFQETGHWTYPEQWKLLNAWIMRRLKK